MGWAQGPGGRDVAGCEQLKTFLGSLVTWQLGNWNNFWWKISVAGGVTFLQNLAAARQYPMVMCLACAVVDHTSCRSHVGSSDQLLMHCRSQVPVQIPFVTPKCEVPTVRPEVPFFGDRSVLSQVFFCSGVGVGAAVQAPCPPGAFVFQSHALHRPAIAHPAHVLHQAWHTISRHGSGGVLGGRWHAAVVCDSCSGVRPR